MTGSGSLFSRFQNWAEETVYCLNEADHWIFRLYDLGNELWAGLTFRGVRARAAELDEQFQTRHGVEARIRFLQPGDGEIFAELLSSFGSRYLPPHPTDAAAAKRALRRRSYLPFGIFVEDQLVGYLLLRCFFFRRIVTGIWTRPQTHNLGIGQDSLKKTAAFSRRERIPDYATIPIDNPNSVRMANAAGWQVIRTNSRFYVLLLSEES